MQELFQTFGLRDAIYPKLLAEISHPPEMLWIRGKAAFEAPALAIVGTRKPTSQGREAARFLSYELTRAGFSIVSGLALGIDTIAHEAALEAGGTTVAVLGSGIDVIAPETNRQLAERIMAQGCLLSEFPPGTAPYPTNFPRRNRIISGLSLGVLVVEAGEKSGALITARYALDQGREVFAVPGSIFSLQSKGTNLLIQEGAKLVMQPEDVITEFMHLPLLASCRASSSTGLEDDARTILGLVEEKGSCTLQEMLQHTTLHTAKLQSILTSLELKGLIKRLDDGTYTPKRVS